MNRVVLTLLLSGTLIGVMKVLLYFLPLNLFPCTLSTRLVANVQTFCSLGDVHGTHPYGDARLTTVGEVVHVIVTWFLPLALSVFLVSYKSSRRALRDENATNA